ncbi:hypothetical protein EAH79_13710 [Sphingomonas koreensis]|nr:hypothetical protein EAH79_13710 [Sphingomonas koreensis]
MRAGEEDRGYKLWVSGEGYDVTPGPGGPLVMRESDIAAARKGVRSASTIADPWVPIGGATVSGRSGEKYMIRGAEKRPGAMAVVISSDPTLSPLRDAFLRYHEMQSATFPGNQGLERSSMRKALSTGAPIDYLDWELVSLSRAPIPAVRLRLPVAPLSADETRNYADPIPETEITPDDLKRRRERSIRRGVFADGRLWLLNDSGAVSSLAPGDRARRHENVPGMVADLCVSGGRVIVLARDSKGDRLWRRAGAEWQPLSPVAVRLGERVEAISCSSKRIIVLTNVQAIVISGGQQQAVQLSEPIHAPSVITTPLDLGSALYVGLDGGEWGGGLAKIDLADGRVSKPSLIKGDMCAGPLNPSCDPVNGVAREPGKPDCLVVAIGLIHFFSHGRLTEVCGREIRRLYYKPYTVQTSWPTDPAIEPSMTVPFFGLARSSNTLWAVGSDGIYEIGDHGLLNFRKLPPFAEVDGVAVSFAVPGLVLVRSSINGHVSLSGSVPLLISR